MNPQLLTWAALATDVTVKATIVIGAAWIATRLARKAPAAARHMIWMGALTGVLMLPALEAVAPRLTLVTIPTQPAIAVAATPSEADLKALAQLTPQQLDELSAEFAPVAQPAPAPPHSVNLVVWVGGAWVSGCAAVLLSALVGWFALNRIKASSVPLPSGIHGNGGGRRVRLKLSREGRPPSALTWGAFRPTILLPQAAESWPEERLETVLLHELEHIRRWDAAMQLIGIAASAVYWFNPLVWLAAKAARSEAEAATDDAVLRRGVRPSAYANTLMEVAAEIGRRPHLVSSTGVAFMKKSKIEARLRAILDGRTRRGVTRTEKAAAMTLAFAIIVPLAFVRAAAVAPFAALPESTDPTVTIHVAPKATGHKKLNKKQLAAQRAHHLRALAARDQAAAAEEKLAARIEARIEAKLAMNASGLTAGQAKQAAETGQLTQNLKIARANESNPAFAKALSDDARARQASGASSNDKYIRDWLEGKAQAGAKANSQGLQIWVQPNTKLDLSAQVKDLNDRTNLKVAVGNLSGVRDLNYRLDASTLSKILELNNRADSRLSVEMRPKVLELNSGIDPTAIAGVLAKVKALDYQVDVAGLNQNNALLRNQADASLSAATRAELLAKLKQSDYNVKLDPAQREKVEAEWRSLLLNDAKLDDQVGQKAGRDAERQAMLKKLEAERAAMNAQRDAMAAQRDGMLRKLEAERALLQAQRSVLQAQRVGMLRKLEAERATMFKVKQEMHATQRLQTDRAIRKSREGRLSREQRIGRASQINRSKAQLERERAALQARLKAIEAELNKKGK